MGRHWARIRASTVRVAAGPALKAINVIGFELDRLDPSHLELAWQVELEEAGLVSVALYLSSDLENAVWEDEAGDWTGDEEIEVSDGGGPTNYTVIFRADGYYNHPVGPTEV